MKRFNLSKIKRTAVVMGCLVLSLSLFAGCSSGAKNGGEYSVDTVTMTYVKAPLNIPSIVQKQQGSFEAAFSQLGLGFAYSDLVSGADQTAALASGNIQILNAVGATSVILSAANGADIKIIGMYSISPRAFTMFSADKSINSPEALRGKTIAGPKGTNLHELLSAYLAKGGLTMEDVDFISMDIPSSFAALENGSIDCALLAGAAAYNCAAAGYNLVADGEGLITGTILTATTQDFYNKNKGIIETFLKVQEDTLKYIEGNYGESMVMAAEATDLDLEAVKEMALNYDFRMNITDEDIAALKRTEKFMLESGLIENEVDIESLFLNP